MHVIFFWRETRRLYNSVGAAGSSPTCEPYEKQQQNQGRLLQEQKLELQHLRYQLQGVRTSSLVWCRSWSRSWSRLWLWLWLWLWYWSWSWIRGWSWSWSWIRSWDANKLNVNNLIELHCCNPVALNGNSAIAVIDNDYTVSVTNPKPLWNWVSDIRKEVCIFRSIWVNCWVCELLSGWCRNRSYASSSSSTSGTCRSRRCALCQRRCWSKC